MPHTTKPRMFYTDDSLDLLTEVGRTTIRPTDKTYTVQTAERVVEVRHDARVYGDVRLFPSWWKILQQSYSWTDFDVKRAALICGKHRNVHS